MIAQNRSNIKEYFDISNRIKKYGNYFSVTDIDTSEDLIYQVSSRGVFPVNFELKACTYEDNIFEAPEVNISQLLQLFFSPIPTLLCYYSSEYSYKVTPANYAGVYFWNIRSTKILSEEEFQEYFSKVSPCAPTDKLNNIIPVPSKYFYYDRQGKKTTGDIYSSFDDILKKVKEYNRSGNIDKAWKNLDNILDEELLAQYRILFNMYRKLSKKVI